MERQLKFRAWDDLNKKWLMGYEHPNLGGFSLTGETVLFGEWGHCFDEFLFSRNGKEPDHIKIMQYTGLNDVNNKESYVGDILEETMLNGDKRLYKIFTVKGGFAINSHQSDFYKEPSKIIFYESLADMQTSSWFESRLEIIGNIHESPQEQTK